MRVSNRVSDYYVKNFRKIHSSIYGACNNIPILDYRSDTPGLFEYFRNPQCY